MSDRAPGEVETVAKALQARYLGQDDWHTFADEARTAIAALDVVRGRSRDDTVTLIEHAEVLASWVESLAQERGSTPAMIEVGRFRSFMARFGAGRAEGEMHHAKDLDQ